MGRVPGDLNMLHLQECSPCPVLLRVCAVCLSLPVPPPQALLPFPMKRGHCASVFWRELRGLPRTRLAGASSRWALALGRVLPASRLPGSCSAFAAFLAVPLGSSVAGLGQEVPWPLSHRAHVEPSPLHWPGTPGMGVQGGRGAHCWVLPVSRGVQASLSLGLSRVSGGRRGSLGEVWAAPMPGPAGRQGWRGSATAKAGRGSDGGQRCTLLRTSETAQTVLHLPRSAQRNLQGSAGEERALPELPHRWSEHRQQGLWGGRRLDPAQPAGSAGGCLPLSRSPPC